MKLYLSFLAFLFCTIAVHAQQLTYDTHISKEATYIGSFVPNKTNKDFAPVLVTQEAPKPGKGIDEATINSIKEGIKGKRKSKLNNKAKTGAPVPEVLASYTGNAYAGSIPNDNSFAVSKGGKMISVINSTIWSYDINTNALIFGISLNAFTLQNISGVTQSKYDPRVIYDPYKDRFIIVFLNGTIHRVSKIVVAFSKTNNPADGFNLYALNGNPLNNDTWSDYPHLIVTKNDFFLTMNTFFDGSTNNSGYHESTIRQLSKNDGYDSAAAITEIYYNNIKVNNKSLFNFTGIQGGIEPTAPPTYFISNKNLDITNDSIFVISISDSVKSSTSPVLNLSIHQTDGNYGLPPHGRQKNNKEFDCNDSRIQGGFIANGHIQIVGNTVNSYGHSSFYHCILNPNDNSKKAYFTILENDSIDYGYPNISYTGKSPLEMEAIITFNHSGPNTNSGSSAIFFANDSSYSEAIMIDSGDAYINILGANNVERWGDYTGGQPDYNETGVVWSATYGSQSNKQPRTTITKLRSPDYNKPPIISIEESQKTIESFSLFPNPTKDYYTITFYLEKADMLTFELINATGQVSTPYFNIKEWANHGDNTFHFMSSALAKGSYYLLIKNSNHEVIQKEKIIKL